MPTTRIATKDCGLSPVQPRVRSRADAPGRTEFLIQMNFSQLPDVARMANALNSLSEALSTLISSSGGL
jgi:hypothetical protein